MAQAVAADTVAHGMGQLPDLGSKESVEVYRSLHLWAERFRFAVLEVGVFGGAAYALTRQRTKQFFEAVAGPTDSGPTDRDQPPS
jgi:hypothetical protein